MSKPIYLLLALAVFAAGCASAPARFYTLNATAKPDGSPAVPGAILVGAVTVPALVDHPQFTVQVTPNRVEQDEFNRWAEPLNENIARVVADNLAVLLGTPDVATALRVDFKPTFQVTIDLGRFNSVPGERVDLEARWTVRKLPGGATFSGHIVVREPTQGRDYEALAAAHSRALAQMSRSIAAQIRAEAAEKPSP
jgi:uncharacterized lipoprotein YmbA